MSKPKIENLNSAHDKSARPITTFRWDSIVQLDPIPEDKRLSHQIFGDDLVISILKKAFSLGLGRNVSWDISRVSNQLRHSMLLAAKVFKRGVLVSGQRDVHNQFEMEHSVTFVDSMSNCFARVSPSDVIIVDRNVANFWWPQLPSNLIPIDFSEPAKNIGTLATVLDLLRSRLMSQSEIYVVGGGVAGDVVGFAAGLLGVRCRYVPTTLLSMVDSSIGGKVGINFEPWGKNQIGLFHAPASVYIWTGWLTSLPKRELKSGLTEAIKHAILSGDYQLWNDLIVIGRDQNWQKLGEKLPTVIEFKRGVTERDPYEVSERAILNLGHTLGHGLETLAHRLGHDVTHGECVALGIFHELRLSEKYCGGDFSSLRTDLLAAEVMPTANRLKNIFGDDQAFEQKRDDLMNILVGDKKSSLQGTIPFILLKEFGQVKRSNDVSWMFDIPIDQAWSEIIETWKAISKSL